MTFRFRLQSVLGYRKTLEEDAKRLLLEARADRLDAEARLAEIGLARRDACLGSFSGLQGRIDLQARLAKLEDEERIAICSLGVLRDEETAAEEVWMEKRRDARAMELLREKALEEWNFEEQRKEQNMLDELATIGRRNR